MVSGKKRAQPDEIWGSTSIIKKLFLRGSNNNELLNSQYKEFCCKTHFKRLIDSELIASQEEGELLLDFPKLPSHFSPVKALL